MSGLLAALLLILSRQAPANHAYQNSQCSYSFEYPSGWQIVKSADDLDCPATLRPVDYEKRIAGDDVDVYTLTVQVAEGAFMEVAAENGFDFDGKWKIQGRQGLSEEAQFTNVNGWMVLRGIAEVGCFHAKGGYAGLCAEHRIIAQHRSDGRIVVITAAAQAEDPISAILKTFKFLAR